MGGGEGVAGMMGGAAGLAGGLLLLGGGLGWLGRLGRACVAWRWREVNVVQEVLVTDHDGGSGLLHRCWSCAGGGGFEGVLGRLACKGGGRARGRIVGPVDGEVAQVHACVGDEVYEVVWPVWRVAAHNNTVQECIGAVEHASGGCSTSVAEVEANRLEHLLSPGRVEMSLWCFLEYYSSFAMKSFIFALAL